MRFKPQATRWVEADSLEERGSIGYIDQVLSLQARVHLVQNKSGGKTNQTSFYYFSDLSPALFEGYYSIAQLEYVIDLALDTFDSDWFLELTERMRGLEMPDMPI